MRIQLTVTSAHNVRGRAIIHLSLPAANAQSNSSLQAIKLCTNEPSYCANAHDSIVTIKLTVQPNPRTQCMTVALPAMGHWGTSPSTFNNFIFSSLWSKSDSQLSKYCVVIAR